MTSKVMEALQHVHRHYPEVTHVFYSVEGRWLYCDGDFEGPQFGPEIDIGLLKDAAASVDELPEAFYLTGV